MLKWINIYLIRLQNNPIFQYSLLLVVTLIAGVFRFYKLGEWSFWGDEIFTVGGREDGFNYNVIRQSISLTLIQSTIAFFGLNEWNARLIPAVVGIVSIPILYLFIKKLFNPMVGLVTVLLLAISPWHIYWSQNARFYTPLLLFYTLALLTFYFGIEQDRPWYLVISLLLLGLATKERLLALFFIPVAVGYLALLKISPFEKPPGLRWRNLILFFLPGLIFGLFFMGPYALNIGGWMEGFGYANNSPFWILASVTYYIGLPVISIGTSGALYLLLQKNRASLLLSLGAVIPLLIMMGIAPFHYTASRYVFITLICWLILAGLAAVELISRTQELVKILAVGALALLLLQPLGEDVLYYRYQNGNRDNWKAAFEFAAEQKQTHDLVVTANTELGDYYLRHQTIDLRDVDLEGIERNDRRVWFVEDMVAQQIFPEVHAWLQKNTCQIADFDVHMQARNFKMRVYLYDPDQRPSVITNDLEKN